MAESDITSIDTLRKTAEELPSEAECKEIFAELFGFEDRLATLRGEHMNRCKTVREDRKDYIERLAAKGYSTKAIAKAFKCEQLEAKKQAIRAELSESEQPFFEHMADQLDMFPERQPVSELKKAS